MAFRLVDVHPLFEPVLEINLKCCLQNGVHFVLNDWPIFDKDNGLVLNRRQAIIWTNDDVIDWRFLCHWTSMIWGGWWIMLLDSTVLWNTILHCISFSSVSVDPGWWRWCDPSDVEEVPLHVLHGQRDSGGERHRRPPSLPALQDRQTECPRNERQWLCNQGNVNCPYPFLD